MHLKNCLFKSFTNFINYLKYNFGMLIEATGVRLVLGRRSDRYLIDDVRGERVPVNNRGTFEKVNEKLGDLLAPALQGFVDTRQGRYVFVADLGGGTQSLCSRVIASKYRGITSVTNIDYLGDEFATRLTSWQRLLGVNPVRVIKYDACNAAYVLPVEGQQVVYSHYLLPNLDRRKGEVTRHLKLLRSTATILTSPGVGLIHIDPDKRNALYEILGQPRSPEYVLDDLGELVIVVKGKVPFSKPF